MNRADTEKKQILDNVEKHIKERFFNPLADFAAWEHSWPEARKAIEMTGNSDEFLKQVNQSLGRLRSSHVAFFHGGGRGVPATHALNATFLTVEDRRPMWMFLDVLEGGVAHRAGIQTGEALMAVDGQPCQPAELPRFAMGTATEFLILSRDGQNRNVRISLPGPPAKGRPPLAEIQTVHGRKVSDNLGYLRVAYFPGAVGDRFAVAYERALAALGPIDGLIIDLRGNIGGGLGSLRVMSSLCADSRPIGYNVSRRASERGYAKEKLARIDKIAMTTAAKLRMFVRFKLVHRDRAIALFTEGLGQRSFHDRIAILINEHTKSAAEMIAAFAAKYQLATLVGTRTAGEVLGAVNFVVGAGYRLRIPIGGWMTWDDQLLEGRGISPDIEVRPSAPELRKGMDPVLGRAIQLLGGGTLTPVARFSAGPLG